MAISKNKQALAQLREMAASGVPGPDWHPDPTGRHATRYWDGQRWTDRVSDVTSDPVGHQP